MALQDNGRLTNVELADRIGLSPSPCARRVKKLEEAGLISGYAAIIDAKKAGLGLPVMIGLKVEKHDQEQSRVLREALAKLPQVISAYLISGESDFLLHVIVPDLAVFEAFHNDHLQALPGVRDIRSHFAIQMIKAPSLLPLMHLPGGE